MSRKTEANEALSTLAAVAVVLGELEESYASGTFDRSDSVYQDRLEVARERLFEVAKAYYVARKNS